MRDNYIFVVLVLLCSLGSVISQLDGINSTDQNLLELLENSIDDPLDTWEPPFELRQKFPYYISGLDDENRPIFIVEFGRWDIRSILEKGGQIAQDFETYTDQSMRRFELGAKQDGLKYLKLADDNPENGEGTVIIVDFDEFSLAQIASPQTLAWIMRTAGKAAKIKDKFAYGFFINANFVAERIINLVRPILGSIMERIEVYGTNEAKWKPRILRKLPQNQIPEWYGGTPKLVPLAVYG